MDKMRHGDTSSPFLTTAMPSTTPILCRLPEELLQDILERLTTGNLSSLNLASRWCYEVATPLLWRNVELVDCRTQHEEGFDEHDDTPLIKKLLILATKPWIASHVQSVTHRCHLPPPAIFYELPQCPFSSQTLSTDPRTIRLVELAVQHMVKVTTLRVIFGHPTLSDALLRCLFNKHRQKKVPVRKLWLENYRISAGCCLSLDHQPYGLPLELDFGGVESVRLRRLPLRPGTTNWPGNIGSDAFQYIYARSDITDDVQDGAGGQYSTTMNAVPTEQAAGLAHRTWLAEELEPTLVKEGSVHNAISPLEHLHGLANRFDDLIYAQMTQWTSPSEQLVLSERYVPSHLQRSELAHRGCYLDPVDLDKIGEPSSALRYMQREKLTSARVATDMLASASLTLTSLTIDWVFTMPSLLEVGRSTQSEQAWVDLFLDLFSLRFPQLRAFQFRNAVVRETQLPRGLYLLDHSRIQFNNGSSGLLEDFDLEAEQRARLDTVCLDFMAAHSNLQCLAWPMTHFFSGNGLPADISSRVEAVIDNLGRTLVDLRVDTLYTGICDPQTENVDSADPGRRDRRRSFIQHFASKMSKVESIKIEGGMPRDERREIIRALHACPLKKIVIIGISCPIGNTWGDGGHDMAESLPHDDTEGLEGEDKDAIWRYGPAPLQPPGPRFRFEAEYGWPPSPPMIHTIASYHAATVTELKFCGYKGAPVLLSPTPVTTPMLSALKHFHNLQSLIMSLHLSTNFEDSPRDADIISYWLNMRSPASTALVRITDEEPEGWEKELRTKYAPDALAWRITSFLGPFLSQQAKSRKGGVHVRASFCIGDWGGIFDVDLTIGKGAVGSDICLGYTGPREELEPERRRSKLDGRRWF